MEIEKTIQGLGSELPEAPKPVVSCAPTVHSGSFVFSSWMPGLPYLGIPPLVILLGSRSESSFSCGRSPSSSATSLMVLSDA